MKLLRKSAVLLLAVGLTTYGSALASDVDSVSAKVSVRQIDAENKKALIKVTNLSEDHSADLIIKDQKGTILYKERVSRGGVYAKKYDFSLLPEQHYIVELKTKHGTITEAITLKAGKPEIQYFKPAIQIQQELVKVAFMNHIATPVSLKLYDAYGKVLYEETIDANQKFVKGLDMSQLEHGQYSLTLLGEHYVYAKSIEVK